MSKKYVVVNSVRINGVSYSQGQEVKPEGEDLKHLLQSGAIVVGSGSEEPSEEFINPFSEIELDDKKSKILIEAGFDSMEKLSGANEETLVNIQGISKKLAKEIIDCFTN